MRRSIRRSSTSSSSSSRSQSRWAKLREKSPHPSDKLSELSLLTVLSGFIASKQQSGPPDTITQHPRSAAAGFVGRTKSLLTRARSGSWTGMGRKRVVALVESADEVEDDVQASECYEDLENDFKVSFARWNWSG